MAVDQTTGRWAYTADGVATIFGFDNVIWAATDIQVYVSKVLVAPTEYSVTGLGQASGGTVVFNTAPAAQAPVVLVSAIPETQETIHADGKELPAKTKDTALDRLMRTQHQLSERQRRTLHPADGDPDGIGTLPDKATRSGKVLGFNATTGDPEAVDPAGGGGAVSSVFGRTGAVVAQTGDYTAAQVTDAAKQSERGEVNDILPIPGATHTLDAADKGKQHEFTSASAVTITVPPDSTPIPIKAVYFFAQDGAGALTFSPGAGVTILAPAGKQAGTNGVGNGGSIMKIGINTWRIQGTLADV